MPHVSHETTLRLKFEEPPLFRTHAPAGAPLTVARVVQLSNEAPGLHFRTQENPRTSPNLPELKSVIAWRISASVFITNGP